ncbi:MAG: hypothetical protein RML57_05530 [Acidobacteriota bacterium]|nr:hypothetical protein [Acidobacteriota bacterium]
MLNNKAPRPLTVHPTLLAPDGQRRDAPPVIVPAQAFRIVPLAELGALVGTPFQEGSIQLVFQGQNLVLGAQLEMLDAARSVLLTERLSDARVALDTPRLEGVYRLPTGGRSTTHFQVAVANLTDRAVNVTVALDGRDRANLPGAKLALGPREARVLDMRAIEGEKLTPEGGVIITSDARGAVRANGLIWNADGYANTVLFTNPFTPRTTQLHANGIRLQLANGQPLTPYFTLHNFGDEPSRVMGKLFLTLPLDGAQTEALPTVTLPPGATATVPVGLPPGLRGRVVSAGAEFEYSTMPGTVAIAGTSESADGNHVFRVPLLDAETIPSATGSYPWRVTATENTTVYLKNATDRALSYHASLNFPGGQYALGRRMIGAHQTVAIDVRALRDAQTPDATGNVIPREATSGQFLWSVHGVDQVHRGAGGVR